MNGSFINNLFSTSTFVMKSNQCDLVEKDVKRCEVIKGNFLFYPLENFHILHKFPFKLYVIKIPNYAKVEYSEEYQFRDYPFRTDSVIITGTFYDFTTSTFHIPMYFQLLCMKTVCPKNQLWDIVVKTYHEKVGIFEYLKDCDDVDIWKSYLCKIEKFFRNLFPRELMKMYYFAITRNGNKYVKDEYYLDLMNAFGSDYFIHRDITRIPKEFQSRKMKNKSNK